MKKKLLRYGENLTYVMPGFLSVYPLTCALTYGFAPDMPYYALMLALLPAAFVLPLFHVELNRVGYLCGFMLFFNFCVGFLIHTGALSGGAEEIFSHSVYVSAFSALSFFILSNVDRARRFGADRLRIPRAMKRHTAAMIAICGTLIAAFSFSPLILAALGAVLRGVRTAFLAVVGFIVSLLSRISFNFAELPPEEGAEGGFDFGVPDDMAGADIPWFFHIAAFLTVAFAALFFLFMLIKLLLWMYGQLKQLFYTRGRREDIAYTEEIEKIGTGRKKRRSVFRGFKPRLRYPASAPERERVKFIYREYVRRAKQAGYTGDCSGHTACEILAEVEKNAAGSVFPRPDGLAPAYNAARYGHGGTEAGGADDLKKRLL